jgi:hypothetical protein
MHAKVDGRRTRAPLELGSGMRPRHQVHAAPVLGDVRERGDGLVAGRAVEPGEREDEFAVPQRKAGPPRFGRIDLGPSEQP